MKFFSKLKKLFSGYLDPENILLDNENKLFWGDLSDTSVKKSSLERILMIDNEKMFIINRCSIWILGPSEVFFKMGLLLF